MRTPRLNWPEWILALCLGLLIIGLIFAIGKVEAISSDLQSSKQTQAQTVKALNVGCKAGNQTRETTRFMLGVLERASAVVGANATTPAIREYFASVLPELRQRAAAPNVQARDCDALYPVTTDTKGAKQ